MALRCFKAVKGLLTLRRKPFEAFCEGLWPTKGTSLAPSHVPLSYLFERLSLKDVLLLCRLVLLERH